MYDVIVCSVSGTVNEHARHSVAMTRLVLTSTGLCTAWNRRPGNLSRCCLYPSITAPTRYAQQYHLRPRYMWKRLDASIKMLRVVKQIHWVLTCVWWKPLWSWPLS